MTLLYMDGFDYLPLQDIDSIITPDFTTTMDLMDAAGYYIRPGAVQTYPWGVREGRFGGSGQRYLYCKKYNGGNGFTTNRVVRPVKTQCTEAFMGTAVYIGEAQILRPPGEGGHPYVGFFDAVNDVAQVVVHFDPNGVLRAYNYGDNENTLSLIGVTKSGVYNTEEWFYIEMRIDVPGGIFEIRINTETVLSLVGANTDPSGSGFVDAYGFGAVIFEVSQNYDYGFDDIYFCDSDGSVNNTWLGNIRVKTQFPTAPGSLTQFSIGGSIPAATNWQSVLNINLDDTKYVESLTIGDRDLYVMDPNLNAPYVHAYQMRSAARMDDATQRILNNTSKTSVGTDILGTDHYVNQKFTYYTDIVELNPDTGVQFTAGQVNLLEAGPKVEA